MLPLLIARYQIVFQNEAFQFPWQMTESLDQVVARRITACGDEFEIRGDAVVHISAVIEQNVILKGHIIIGPNCFISANAYIRGPVFLDEEVKIGAGCEIKHSVIFSQTAVAHFNYIGNSIIGSRVNFEAGSVAANHFNERADKKIRVQYNNQLLDTGVTKFGSLVGDDCKIGANAVLSPGSILPKGTVVPRLGLWENSKVKT